MIPNSDGSLLEDIFHGLHITDIWRLCVTRTQILCVLVSKFAGLVGRLPNKYSKCALKLFVGRNWDRRAVDVTCQYLLQVTASLLSLSTPPWFRISILVKKIPVPKDTCIITVIVEFSFHPNLKRVCTMLSFNFQTMLEVLD